MKKILLLTFILISTLLRSQTIPIPITSGMTGLQLRNALNTNFDSLDARWHAIWALDSIYRVGGGNGEINVKTYGAKGNGITNDKAAIEAALLDAGGRTVVFPPGNYRATRGISLTGIDTSITIRGYGSTIIIDGALSGDVGISLTSTYGAAQAIDENVSDGSYFILSSTLDDVLPGDILMLHDDSINLETLHYNYQFAEVDRHSATGDTVFLSNPVENPLLLSYNAYAYKMNNNKFDISGLNIIGTSLVPVYGIATNYCNNVTISNCKIRTTYYAAIMCNYGLNVDIFNNFITDCDYQGYGYGISMSSINTANVHHNEVKNSRHCIETGGSGPATNININNNILHSPLQKTRIVGNHIVRTFDAGIVAHPNDKRLTISNNTIYGDGIFTPASTVTISGNTIYETEFGQIGILVNSDGVDTLIQNVIIDNNKLITQYKTDTIYSTLGINLTCTSGGYLNSAVVRNNYVTRAAHPFALYNSLPYTFHVKELYVTGNEFIDNLSQTISMVCDSGIIVDKMVFSNNNFPDHIVYADPDTCYKATFINNNFNGLRIGHVDTLIIKNNQFQQRLNGDIQFLNYNVIVDTCNTVIVSGNSLTNYVSPNDDCFQLNHVTNFLHEGNHFFNCTDNFERNIVTNEFAGIDYKDFGLLGMTATATSDGLTTGQLIYSYQNIIISSSNSNYICCLPITNTGTIGLVISGQVGSNGFELRPHASQAGTVYINNVTTNVEAAIPANSTFEIRCVDATHWLLKVWAADGTYSAPIPDAI
jgi:hypothetical protein